MASAKSARAARLEWGQDPGRPLESIQDQAGASLEFVAVVVAALEDVADGQLGEGVLASGPPGRGSRAW